MKTKKLLIIGDGEFAENVYEHFTMDSDYEVVGFAVEKEYLSRDNLFGLPVLTIEDAIVKIPPKTAESFVAITKTNLNHTRNRLIFRCNEAGYKAASYVSPQAFVSPSATIGKNVFVFENATVQYKVTIGDGSIIWCNAVVAHNSTVGRCCWISPGATISGRVEIGNFAYISSNATVGENVRISENVVLGAGSVTVKDLPEDGGLYIGSPARKQLKSAFDLFKITENNS